jgi:hypothetical protein
VTKPAASQVIEAAADDAAGVVIAELITKEVENARAAAASIQGRGLAVISSSGTLVTLLFGLSALATKAQSFTLPSSVKLPLDLAAVFLVLAALAGIVTNAPRRSDVVALKNLSPLLEDQYWHAPAFEAKREVARTQLAVAQAARTLNIRAARCLLTAIAFELAGVASVMWSVMALIASV